MLQLNGITFSFNGKQPFFNDLSLQFDRHQLYFIQGKNGSGKSTFFRILRGDIKNTEYISGSIIINNQSIALQSKIPALSLAQHIKMVDQNINNMIADQLTVAENIKLASIATFPFLHPLPLLPKDNLLTKFNIAMHKHVYDLSGGQKQILALAMTVQKPTHILLLDEPTAALDEKNANLVLQYLQELAHSHNIIVLIITHDRQLVEKYAQGTYLEIKEQPDGTRIIQPTIT
jgi:ABC-type lipoprotein export system ATPase subunit